MAADIFTKAFECKDKWAKACELIGMYHEEDLDIQERLVEPVSIDMAPCTFDHKNFLRTQEFLTSENVDEMFTDIPCPSPYNTETVPLPERADHVFPVIQKGKSDEH